MEQKNGKVEIWLTNDQLKPVTGTVVAEVRTFAGKLIRRHRFPARVAAGSAKLIKKLPVTDATTTFLQLTFNDATNTHFFTEYKRCELAKPKIRIQARKDYRVTLRTDKPAFFVSLNATGIRGEFDDNCVTLLPGKAQTFRFTPKQPVTFAAFKKSLTVNHLQGTYS